MEVNELNKQAIIEKIQKELLSETVLMEGLSKWVVDEFCEFYVTDNEFSAEEKEMFKARIDFLKQNILEKSFGKEAVIERYSAKGVLQFMADNWMYLISGVPETYQLIADMLVYHDTTCKPYDVGTYEHIHAILAHPGAFIFFESHFDAEIPPKWIILNE